MQDDTTRRNFLKLTGAGAIASVLPALAACGGGTAGASNGLHPAGASPSPPVVPVPCLAAADAGADRGDPGTLPPGDLLKIRIASVPTAVEGNLLPLLVADFEKATGSSITIEASEEPFALARAGKADLVISHYGHRHLEEFVLEGFGEWPRTIFSNQTVLVGPPGDPAKVRGLADAAEAFRRIAAKKVPFIVNPHDGGGYLAALLWAAAGKPDKAGWFIEDAAKKEDMVHIAVQKRAYMLWGLTPFVRTDKDAHIDLEPLVLADPLLQRILVCTLVKASRTAAINTVGAHAFQKDLLSPGTQAKIRDTRYPGAARAMWTPAGRHNRNSLLRVD
jgi:tungstate transport system substrate-binding protein